jgi:hypothetical protein
LLDLALDESRGEMGNDPALDLRSADPNGGSEIVKRTQTRSKPHQQEADHPPKRPLKRWQNGAHAQGLRSAAAKSRRAFARSAPFWQDQIATGASGGMS